eukprot:1189513-Prorocentrum_minimum.AAC.2
MTDQSNALLVSLRTHRVCGRSTPRHMVGNGVPCAGAGGDGGHVPVSGGYRPPVLRGALLGDALLCVGGGVDATARRRHAGAAQAGALSAALLGRNCAPPRAGAPSGILIGLP